MTKKRPNHHFSVSTQEIAAKWEWRDFYAVFSASSTTSRDSPHQVGWSQIGPACCRSTGGWLEPVSLALPAPAFYLLIDSLIQFSKSLSHIKPQTAKSTSCPCSVSLSPAEPRPGLSVHSSTSKLINIIFILPSQHPSAPHSTGDWLSAMWNRNTFLIITRSQSTTSLINIQLFSLHCLCFQE